MPFPSPTPTPAIRVFAVDDHPMIIHGLSALVATRSNLLWVGDAADGESAVANAPALRPDVLLVDLAMPGMDGAATIAALRPLLPQASFIVLTGRPDPLELRRAIAAGACGYLLKDISAEELSRVIQAAYRRSQLPAPGIGERQMDAERHRTPGADLTQRELELLTLMARGLSNQDICTELAIAMPTVKFHVTNILAKLHAKKRTEAVVLALRHQLVRLD